MKTPDTILGGMAPADFLKEYWQKKPLLIRNALPGFTSPLTPADVAGLACEEDVTARLIIEKGGDYPWQLRHGPLDESDFGSLPETHWTLLVQEVDRLVPEVAALLGLFRFIPNWRIDDVMVSYAPEGGSVGAHIDNYDVFLLQALGKRRWQINNTPVDDEVLVEDLDVRILKDFTPDEDWVLSPGDVLYLPPRIAHYGVALDDCMTFSIGFRAPSYEELLSGYVMDAVVRLNLSDRRYSDPELKPQNNPGEISPAVLAKIRAVFDELLRDTRQIDRWFGRFITEPRRGVYQTTPDEPYTETEVGDLLLHTAALERSISARFSYIQHANGDASLFVNGGEYYLESDVAFVAPLLSGGEPLNADALQPFLRKEGFVRVITELINEGFLEISEVPEAGIE